MILCDIGVPELGFTVNSVAANALLFFLLSNQARWAGHMPKSRAPLRESLLFFRCAKPTYRGRSACRPSRWQLADLLGYAYSSSISLRGWQMTAILSNGRTTVLGHRRHQRAARAMSALGQERTLVRERRNVSSGSEADIGRVASNVRFGPVADIDRAALGQEQTLLNRLQSIG